MHRMHVAMHDIHDWSPSGASSFLFFSNSSTFMLLSRSRSESARRPVLVCPREDWSPAIGDKLQHFSFFGIRCIDIASDSHNIQAFRALDPASLSSSVWSQHTASY